MVTSCVCEQYLCKTLCPNSLKFYWWKGYRANYKVSDFKTFEIVSGSVGIIGHDIPFKNKPDLNAWLTLPNLQTHELTH